MVKGQKKPAGCIIERLSIYRSVLSRLMDNKGRTHIYSHELGALSGSTSAQVRRDLMVVGGYGTAAHGYEIQLLLEAIKKYMDKPEPAKIALAGVGNLGRAILTYLAGDATNMKVTAAFDKDGRKNRRTFEGVQCHPVEKMEEIIKNENIDVGIIAVPAEAAQEIADIMVKSGVKGLLCLAPIFLEVPENVHLEIADLGIFLRKTVFFATH